MNEELEIIVSVDGADAKKELDKISDKVEDVGESSKKADEEVSNAMEQIKGSILKATAAIAALGAAFVALGQNALEASKGLEKLNTTFITMGSSTQQATETYKELYSFLGDHDKAIETAQSLALITTEAEGLAEWSNILQGAFSLMGEKLPIEGLAEAANETIKVGQVTGVLADALNWAGVSEDAFNAALAETTNISEREALVRSTLNGLYSGAAKLYEKNNQQTILYNKSQASLNVALAQTAAFTTPLLTALNNLGATMLSVFSPAIRTVSLYLTAFIEIIAEAIGWVGSFFDTVSSKASTSAADVSGYNAAMEKYNKDLSAYFSKTGAGIDGNINKLKELKKQTMGFDELNVVADPSASDSSGGGGGGIDLSGMPTAPNPSDYGLDAGISSGNFIDFSDFKKDLEEAKKQLEGILSLIGIIGTGFAAWKLGTFLANLSSATNLIQRSKKEGALAYEVLLGKKAQKSLDTMKNKMQTLLGKVLLVAGAFLTIKGYSEAWVKGIEWDNLLTTLGGIGTIIAGIALTLGGAQAMFASVIGGVAMFIVSLKDLIQNGPSVQNVIGLIAGALLILIPIIWAFNTSLYANPIVLIVTACVALVAGITALIAAFALEEPAIKSVEEAQLALNEAKQAAIDTEVSYISSLESAEAALKKLQEVEAESGISGADLYKQVREGTLEYKDMTEQQKEVYKAYLDNEQKQKDLEESTKAFNEAKEAEIQASFENQLALAKESGSYDEYKKAVVDAFEKGQLSAEEAKDLLSKSMSEMSDSAQTAFMEDIPTALKDGLDPHKYESTGTKISKFFSNLWQGITEGAKIAWDGLTSFFKDTVNWIIDGLNILWGGIYKAIKGIVDAIGGVAGAIGSLIGQDWYFSMPEDPPLIPKLAKGGIAERATMAIVGEAGKEAVLPLENNTEWMDTLAYRIAEKQNSPSKIVLALDGKELGWASINSINGITKQTGELQLVLV